MGSCDSGFRSLSKSSTNSRATITLQSPCNFPPLSTVIQWLCVSFTHFSYFITKRRKIEAEGVGLEPTHRINDTDFQDRGGNQLRFILPIPGLFIECPSKILLFAVVNGIEPLSSGPKPDVLAFILND